MRKIASILALVLVAALALSFTGCGSKSSDGTITMQIWDTAQRDGMQALADAYHEINPDVNITLQTQDSSTGMSNAASGVYDIGMASREVKDEEIAQGLVPITIATDGIAVVVNNENPITDITAEQICSIYIGEITTWDELAA